MITINQLTKHYGKARGVENITLQIPKGTIYGFIGPNGAGKSTTIKCMMNLLNQYEGEIYIDEQLVSNKNYRAKQEIGYLPSEIHLYDNLTVKKMLDYSASFYAKDCSKRTQELVQKLEVDETKKIEELSLGNLKKVGIIIALMHEPKVVIMDEATSGLDPLMQEKFYEILTEEKEKGTTIFFSSHVLSEVKKICDQVAIIKEGKIIKIEEMNHFSTSEMVQVTIKTNQIEEIITNLPIKTIQKRQEDEIQFLYEGKTNELVQTLAKIDVKKLIIEELNLEEIFMHYYQ